MVKICIVQKKPAYLDVTRSMALLREYLREAAEEGSNLVVFGETWLTGYPKWLDLVRDIAAWDWEPAKEVYKLMWKNSIQVPGPETSVLGKLARDYKLTLGIGVNERVESGPGNKTLYNTLLLFDESGTLKIHHRKMMPTYTEKMIYGLGDAAGLKSQKTGAGYISGLICWEHWMPLARHALHVAGEEIHLALWPSVGEMHQVASRQYAFEGRCFVIAAGQIMHLDDIPDILKPYLHDELPDPVLNGGSCVFAPSGEILVAPQFENEKLIFADLDTDLITKEQMTLSAGGHYFRPDLFKVKIRKKRD